LLSLAAQEAFFSCAPLFGIAEAIRVDGAAVFVHCVEDADQLVVGVLLASQQNAPTRMPERAAHREPIFRDFYQQNASGIGPPDLMAGRRPPLIRTSAMNASGSSRLWFHCMLE